MALIGGFMSANNMNSPSDREDQMLDKSEEAYLNKVTQDNKKKEVDANWQTWSYW